MRESFSSNSWLSNKLTNCLKKKKRLTLQASLSSSVLRCLALWFGEHSFQLTSGTVHFIFFYNFSVSFIFCFEPSVQLISLYFWVGFIQLCTSVYWWPYLCLWLYAHKHPLKSTLDEFNLFHYEPIVCSFRFFFSYGWLSVGVKINYFLISICCLFLCSVFVYIMFRLLTNSLSGCWKRWEVSM